MLNNIKNKNDKLKKIFLEILKTIEEKKENFSWDELQILISDYFSKQNMDCVISVIDDQGKNLLVKQIRYKDDQDDFLQDKFLNQKINFESIKNYKKVFESKKIKYCEQGNYSLFGYFLSFHKKEKYFEKNNAIVAPLILNKDVIGFLEICSSWIKEEDILLVESFVKGLILRITNIILFNELKKSEERYRNLFEKAKDGFFRINGRLMRFVEVNNELCRMTQFSKKELLEMNILSLFYKSEQKRLEKYIYERLNNKKMLNLGEKAPLNYEIKILKKDKSILNVELNILQFISKEEWFVKVKDVTLRKNAELALRENEEKYRSLINNAEDAISILDSKGFFIFGNDAFFELTEYKKEEARGMHFSQVIYPDDYNYVVERFSSRIKGNKLEKNIFEFRIITKNKKIKQVSLNSSVIIKKSKVVGLQSIIRDVTESKDLLKRIEYSKKHYEQVIDAIQDAICVIGDDLLLKSANKAFSKKVNIPINKIKNKSCADILKRFDNNLFVNEFCNLNCGIGECKIIDLIKKEKFVSKIIKTKHNKKNISLYYKVNIYPNKINEQEKQAVLIIRDITKRKEAENEIKRLSEFNKRIIDNVPISILVLDNNGKIISKNNFANKLIKENIVNLLESKPILKNKDLFKKYQLLFKKGKTFYYNNMPYFSEKEKKYKFLNIIAVPLFDKNKKIDGAISMAQDNTETVLMREGMENLNKTLELKVLDRTEEIDKINKELKNVLVLKSKFISDASHELRTPLTIIQGNIDLAIQEAKIACSEEIPEFYFLIDKEMKRMSSILNDLTMLTNVDSNTERIEYEPVNINLLIKTVYESVRILAKQKNINIKIKKNIDKNLFVMGDEAKLEKLFLNILRNAIKYTDEKGDVIIDVEETDKGVEIEVADTGIGIPKEDIDFIFERFYRVDKARSRKEGGTGLGLSICKSIVDAHKGEIWVDSDLGVGTAFIVFLPFNK